MLEKVGVGLGIFGIALVSNILAPLMACGLPRIKNVLGLKIKDVRVEHFPAETDRYGDDIPEYLDIKYGSETVSILVDELAIMSYTNDMKPYSFGIGNDSGSLGFIFFGIPGMLIASPVIGLCNAMWIGVYKATDMNVHLYLFWRRIKDQLDADTRAKLKEALIKASRTEVAGEPHK